jgi:2-polyprenyl-3-methyl-5-hydroxy-6-metoxy-1,4-benzoquinol methylase
MMHEGLIDYFFKCAPGEWSLYECTNCESAYLDPRPTEETIGLAYDNYFTHTITPPVTSRHPSTLRRFIRRISNGYLNAAFGCKRSDASRIGSVLVPVIKPVELYLQAEARHLPKLPDNGGILLDIGCGNGDFIQLAHESGWETFGLDPDPKAVEATKSLGLDAQVGGIESINDQSQVYDIITSSHVIEHVHKPFDLLKACHRLLKPGGILWLETPNIKSYGHKFYRRYWRGLETPRHLVVFSPLGLLNMLNDVGFINIEQKHRALSTFYSFPESERVLSRARRAGQSSNLPVRVPLLLRYLYAEILEAIAPHRREFLTIIAFKAE